MAGLGSVWVELQLDRSQFDRSLQKLERDATSVPINIEQSFRDLGIKSSYQFDLLRQQAGLRFDAIKNHAKSTADDILRAEKAKTDMINRLNEEQFGKQTTLLQTLRSHWLAASAAIYAAVRVIGQAWDMASEAADFQERVNSLDALGRQAGLTGEQVVRGMQFASRGLLSMKESADLAASALNLNLSADQMIRFTKAAEAMTDVIGGSIPEAFNRLTVAAASGRTQTLAQMGIIIDLEEVYKRYAESIGKTVKELSEAEKQHARVTAILEETETKMARLGEATDTTADKMQRVGVIISDLSLKVGMKLADAFLAVYDTMYPVNKKLEEQKKLVGEVTASFDAYIGVLQKVEQPPVTHVPTMLPDTRISLTIRPTTPKLSPQAQAPGAAEDGKKAAEAAKKAADEREKAIQKMQQNETDMWVGIVERQQAVDEQIAKLDAERLQTTAKETADGLALVQKNYDDAWVKIIDEQKDIDFELAKLQADSLQQQARTREDAQKEMEKNDERVRQFQLDAEEDFQRDSRDAWGYYWKSVTEASRNTYDRVGDMTKQFSRTMTQSLDDLFFNVLTGRFKSFGDWLEQLWGGIARTLSNQLAQSLMSGLTGSGGGIVGLAQSIMGGVSSLVSGASTVGSAISSGVSAVGKFLGFLDVGMWSVPGSSAASASSYGGRWKLPSETVPTVQSITTTNQLPVAVLHPGEMVLPPDIAELIRKAVAAAGGSTGFQGLQELLTGGGRGASSSMGGTYGTMSAAERSTISMGARGVSGLGYGLGLLGAPTIGTTMLGLTAQSILGIDAFMSAYGLASRGYVGPTEAELQAVRDYEGAYAAQAARTEAAINQSLSFDAAIASALAAQAAASMTGESSPSQAARDAAAASFAADLSQLGAYSDSAAATGISDIGGFTGGFGPGGAELGSDTGGSAPDSGTPDGSVGEATGGTPGGESDSSWASGGMFTTRGRTRMTVGEAGTETVAVLRNPRAADLGGGGSVTVNLYNSGVIGNQLPDTLMREIQRELDRRASRRIRY